MSITIVVRSNKLPLLNMQARARAEAAVAKAAYDIEGQAKTVVPVDTGNLKNSIQTEAGDSDLTKYVGPHTDYAVYVEYGTYKTRAQPYMRPAAEQVAPGFIAAMKQIADI